VDWSGVLGPPWTDSSVARGHGGALTGAWPLAAPVRQSSPVGAQNGEGSEGNSARASPELGRHCGSQATVVQNREGKVWFYSGVVLTFYRGRGSAGEEMWVGNSRGFTADAIDGREGVNGASRGGIKAGE
jgi:hypothetical protein